MIRSRDERQAVAYLIPSGDSPCATSPCLSSPSLTTAFFAIAEPVDRSATEIEAHSDGVWTQWRGPDRNASVPTGEWPKDLSSLQPGWRVELGPSYSGPIVGDDLVFTTETRDESSEVVSAYDRATATASATR